MPLPHRDPAITAYVRYVVIGVDNDEPTKVAARLGVSGAWVVNVRDGHRGVGLDALRKIANVHFDGSLDRLEATARAWASAHPEALSGRAPATADAPNPLENVARGATKGRRTKRTKTPLPPPVLLENLRAARERLLDRGYPRDAINEALLDTSSEDSSDVLLVFDRAERHLIAQGYAAQLQKLLRQGRRGSIPPAAASPVTPPRKADTSSGAKRPSRGRKKSP